MIRKNPHSGTKLLIMALLAVLFGAPRAHAIGFYIESGIGTSKIQSGENFYDSPGSSSTGFGLAFDMSFFTVLSDGHSPLELHVGLQPRYSTASQGSSYTLLAAYPVARLQLSRLSLAGGATPLIWKRVGASAGFDEIASVNSSLAYFGEVAVLWPVTPDFTLGLAGAMQFVSTGGVLSPNPVIDLTMTMRFYLGFLDGGKGTGGRSSRSSNEFKGWRYPFGEIR